MNQPHEPTLWTNLMNLSLYLKCVMSPGGGQDWQGVPGTAEHEETRTGLIVTLTFGFMFYTIPSSHAWLGMKLELNRIWTKNRVLDESWTKKCHQSSWELLSILLLSRREPRLPTPLLFSFTQHLRLWISGVVCCKLHTSHPHLPQPGAVRGLGGGAAETSPDRGEGEHVLSPSQTRVTSGEHVRQGKVQRGLAGRGLGRGGEAGAKGLPPGM